MTYREITVSAYLMTEDPMIAAQAAEKLSSLMTGFALEGGVETVVKVGTCDTEEDIIVQAELDLPPNDDPAI